MIAAGVEESAHQPVDQRRRASRISRSICRRRFPVPIHGFLMQCMIALGCRNIRLDDDV